MRPYFEDADEDDNHTLDELELSKMLRSLLTDLAVPRTIISQVETSVSQVLKEMDKDNDGKISFPEFMEYFVWGSAQDGSSVVAKEGGKAAATAMAAVEGEEKAGGQLVELMKLLLN
eukprot:CAMPEP_0119521520 /NCGR_PEP_ID=MMETSP1344-20130328/37182_1 /TAXON_ID=236787 /ORGANISM="Florenciella parvula, Strain CCMP2471" /LENGTH=116 /DNA_ID=CAMNT_0007559497 /DNA_START=104 /DNA_END=451 /DNA_ORIENTATION=+